MNALCVKELTKRYPSFTLDGVCFCVEEGRVAGLIGANGAGKTTTLKAITGLIRAEGEVQIFGTDAVRHAREVKSQLGYIGGGFRYYPQKTVSAVARAVSYSYPAWNGDTFAKYLQRYSIDGGKKVSELSDGMKVKFYLALALSHGARLLILDEPTSGLDPLSREDFCDTILSLVKNEGVSVLFSTHVTSDLERIADDIVMLSGGKVIACEELSTLQSGYFLIQGTSAEALKGAGALGVKRIRDGWEGIVTEKSAGSRTATLDEIMVHLEIERRNKEEIR